MPTDTLGITSRCTVAVRREVVSSCTALTCPFRRGTTTACIEVDDTVFLGYKSYTITGIDGSYVRLCGHPLPVPSTQVSKKCPRCTRAVQPEE